MLFAFITFLIILLLLLPLIVMSWRLVKKIIRSLFLSSGRIIWLLYVIYIMSGVLLMQYLGSNSYLGIFKPFFLLVYVLPPIIVFVVYLIRPRLLLFLLVLMSILNLNLTYTHLKVRSHLNWYLEFSSKLHQGEYHDYQVVGWQAVQTWLSLNHQNFEVFPEELHTYHQELLKDKRASQVRLLIENSIQELGKSPLNQPINHTQITYLHETFDLWNQYYQANGDVLLKDPGRLLGIRQRVKVFKWWLDLLPEEPSQAFLLKVFLDQLAQTDRQNLYMYNAQTCHQMWSDYILLRDMLGQLSNYYPELDQSVEHCIDVFKEFS